MSNLASSRIKKPPIEINDCSMARAADLIGDKWTLLILRELFYGVSRFEDLRQDMAAPRAVLSQRLQRLVDEGIIEKHPYQERGSRTRFEYRMTEKGVELGLVLLALMQWGDKHLRTDPEPLSIIDAKTREKLVVAFATRKGRVVPTAQVTTKISAIKRAK